MKHKKILLLGLMLVLMLALLTACAPGDGANTAETEASSSIVNPETSMAGVLGSAIIAALIFAAGFLFGRKPHSHCPR